MIQEEVVELFQTYYINHILEQFGVLEYRTNKTPMTSNFHDYL